jgi:hypothetical protein
MTDLDQIDDIVENSIELTEDMKGPLRWAVKKAREKRNARRSSLFRDPDLLDVEDI